MKLLTRIFSSKEDIIKKIQKNAEKRVKDYTTVSSAFKPEDSKAIKDNLDSIARYAKHNNINLEFEPVSKNSDVKMRVFKRSLKKADSFDGKIISYLGQDFAGEAYLPSGIKDKKEIMNLIKTESAKILYGEK